MAQAGVLSHRMETQDNMGSWKPTGIDTYLMANLTSNIPLLIAPVLNACSIAGYILLTGVRVMSGLIIVDNHNSSEIKLA
uniref:Uncharacterized protein n=1 Tax=Solanum demissum TaxID=50514 RepID=Q0KIM0_SOLDE|nr:hypothetical protein SDM1_49t00011 [Solanum demissum]